LTNLFLKTRQLKTDFLRICLNLRTYLVFKDHVSACFAEDVILTEQILFVNKILKLFFNY